MNKTLTMFLLLLATAVLVGCRQRPSQENGATPTANATQTPPATATGPLAPIQQETAVPPPTITPLALTTNDATATPLLWGEGALIQLKMESQVGVLLDEIPTEWRDEAAAALLARPASYWLAQA